MSSYTLWLRRLSPLLIFIFSVIVFILLNPSKPELKQDAQKPALPIVEVMEISPQSLALIIPSYGVAQPKYKTKVVAEVSGRIIELSPVFVSGGFLRKGDVLAKIDPADYHADLLQTEAQFAQAQASLDEEMARGEVAKVEFKGYDSGTPPSLGLRKPQLQREQANVKAAKAALEKAKRNFERTVISAPFDAIVKARSADLGQFVSTGSEIGQLFDTQVAEIRLPISTHDLVHLESLMSPNIDVELMSKLGGNSQHWQGRITRSEGIVDEKSRMAYLIAEVQDPYQRESQQQEQALPLQFGTFLDANITGKVVSQAVKLPRHLVRDGLVAVVTPENKIEMRTVLPVRSDAENVYIQNAFKTGDRVSLTQFTSLANGQEVEILGEQTSEEPTQETQQETK
ncbi:efflux RND transporter periplasmic adaptor subunit [Shewanella sp. OPT22]|nr:efflux RND transporter periplasmic adaptor subunit [Shewanella sp. OPT22]